MVELAPFSILVLHGPNLIVDAYNPRYTRVLESQPVQGRPLDEVIDFFWEGGLELVHRARDAYRLDAVQVTHWVLTHRVSTENQEERSKGSYFGYTLVPSHDPGGKVNGVIIYALDETEERFREVEKERARLQLIFDNLSHAALALFDAQTSELLMGSTYYLKNVARATGISQGELVGRKWHELTFLPSADEATRFWEQALQEQKLIRLPELTYTFRPNGPDVIWDYTITPLLDTEPGEQVRYILISFIEITEQVQARRNLEQADALRDDFLSLTTHELRGPLTTMKGNAQLLQRMVQRRQNGQPEDPDLQQEVAMTRQIVHQTERMNRLIGEMFDVARLRNQAFELHQVENVDLVALVRHMVETYTVPNREIRLDADGQKALGRYDPDRIEQVLQNLLSNAIKYSPPEKPVLVTVQLHENEVVIAVKDEGEGIAEDDLAHIFDRFYRTEHSRNGKVEGLGLGLYIAYGIVEQQGGHMWCESQPGKGSTFFCSFPLQPK